VGGGGGGVFAGVGCVCLVWTLLGGGGVLVVFATENYSRERWPV